MEEPGGGRPMEQRNLLSKDPSKDIAWTSEEFQVLQQQMQRCDSSGRMRWTDLAKRWPELGPGFPTRSVKSLKHKWQRHLAANASTQQARAPRDNTAGGSVPPHQASVSQGDYTSLLAQVERLQEQVSMFASSILTSSIVQPDSGRTTTTSGCTTHDENRHLVLYLDGDLYMYERSAQVLANVLQVSAM